MQTIPTKCSFLRVNSPVRLSIAALAFLSCLSATAGCNNGSSGNLKTDDVKRIKTEKVTAETLSDAQMQAARTEIGQKLSKSSGPTDVPQLNPASVGKPK